MNDLDIILEALDRARDEAAINDADETPYILLSIALRKIRKEVEEQEAANDREAYNDSIGTLGQQ